MSRYIDAENAMFQMLCCGTYHGVIAFDTVKSVINDAPSLDIVFCKDCRNFVGEGMYCNLDRYCKSDDFCSYGEREGE